MLRTVFDGAEDFGASVAEIVAMPGCAIVVPAIGTLSCRALLPFTLVRQRAPAASCFADAPSVRSAVVGRRPQGVGRSYFPDIVLASGSHSSGAVQTRTRLFSGQRLGGVPCLWICERMLDG